MNQIELIATTRIGMESLVKQELLSLGFDQLSVSNGKVEFPARLSDIPKVNLWLRCADRVLLKVGSFQAHTFDQLYERCRALPWEEMIVADGQFPVIGKSVKSALRSVRSCQSIVKKAVADRLVEAHQTPRLSETGPEFTIQISLLRNVATLAIDTSGAGLHKRGYRAQTVEAPLKETLAAALVMLSGWERDQLLIDPLCGSGTILIEAALIARNTAPGLRRRFSSETWPLFGPSTWREVRQQASQAQIRSSETQLLGYDISDAAIELARENAQLAGVADSLTFETRDLRDLWIDRQFGFVITNPPYGIRISDFSTINALYRTLNQMFRKKAGWSVNVLTADERFPSFFKRSQPDRIRKLYNGPVKAYYYQYWATSSKPA